MVGQYSGPRALINMARQPGNEFGALCVVGIIQDGVTRVIDLARYALTGLFIKKIPMIKFQNAGRQD